MPLSKFGPFASVFAQGELKVPGHLELLGLQAASAQIVFDRIQQALSAGPGRVWIDALFEEPDWRPHLVGAIALLIDDGTTLDVERLWCAVDAGSWVIPQLVVTASFVDPEFPEQLGRRVEAGCPISVPKALSPPERHSATGPGSAHHRSAKLLVSLLAAGAKLPTLSARIEAIRSEPAVAELAAHDVDHADVIVEHWRGALVRQFSDWGRELRPKVGAEVGSQ